MFSRETVSNLSILISNAPSPFFFLCAHRLFHRGSSLGGIASDPLRLGSGITAWGDAVRRPLILVSFSILIPNTVLSPTSSLLWDAGARDGVSTLSCRSRSMRGAVAPDDRGALSPGSSFLRDAVAPDSEGALSPRLSSMRGAGAPDGKRALSPWSSFAVGRRDN